MELVSNTGETTFSLFPRSLNILEVVTVLQKRDQLSTVFPFECFISLVT